MLRGRVATGAAAGVLAAAMLLAWLGAHVSGADADEAPLWGTYKSNLFFALRTRVPEPTVVGLMWARSADWQLANELRHECTEDAMGHYTWLEHDGRSFGVEQLVDRKHSVRLTISFVRTARDGNATQSDVRVRVQADALEGGDAPARQAPLALFVYTTVEAAAAALDVQRGADDRVVVAGTSPELGAFSVRLPAAGAATATATRADYKKFKARAPDRAHVWTGALPGGELWRVKERAAALLQESTKAMYEAVAKAARRTAAPPAPPAIEGLYPTLPPAKHTGAANMAIVQRILTVPFVYEFALGPAAPSASDEAEAGAPGGASFDALLAARSHAYAAQLEGTLGLAAKGYGAAPQRVARSAVSNLLGGLSYFYGASLVHDPSAPARGARGSSGASVFAPAHALLTCVPSRSFFPRGFLWDEGFHQVLVGLVDPALSRAVVRHWLGLVDASGWVAREQILGEEARSRVPAEFQTQHRDFANPPTLLFSLRAARERWRARRNLVPLALAQAPTDGGLGVGASMDALAAGADDADAALLRDVFPAARRQFDWFIATQSGTVPHTFRWRGRTENHTLPSGLDDYPRPRPSPFEMHVDLLCWMAFAARELSAVAQALGDEAQAAELARLGEAYVHNLQLHWHADSLSFADRGPGAREADAHGTGHQPHAGYVALFPLMLELVEPDAPQLGAMLDMLEDPAKLWSPHGVRSLAADDPLFGTNENYWRGPIWINANYLICAALHRKYAALPGPYRDRAQRVYGALRANLVNTIVASYERTGYFWEQYNPTTGRGQRTHPFAGWTTLLAAIMAELYA